MSADAKLTELGLELPPPPKPIGVYKPALIVGDMCQLSGHGPLRTNETLITGRVGLELDEKGGYDAARQTGLAILATLRNTLGSLDRVTQVVNVIGMVNAVLIFKNHPKVIDGCSELFAEVFGREIGIGTRSAIGMYTLPGNIPVEIQSVFQITPE